MQSVEHNSSAAALFGSGALVLPLNPDAPSVEHAAVLALITAIVNMPDGMLQQMELELTALIQSGAIDPVTNPNIRVALVALPSFREIQTEAQLFFGVAK